ncbi:hypothetical protein ACH5RR_001836 [Cinchona calisaya]|uniref:Uncharacterized protein n=1 Tax=Cinchona calisaya TaxID=153742 RepID=A0ABD3B4J8_9GENT
MQPTVLSLWNEFIENEDRILSQQVSKFSVVICRRLKVISYDGIGLSTRKDSVILIDPLKRDARQMKNWFDVDLTDGSETITVSVFAELGKRLLGFNVVQAMKHTIQSKCSSSKVRVCLTSKIDTAESVENGENAEDAENPAGIENSREHHSSDDESRKAKKAKLN